MSILRLSEVIAEKILIKILIKIYVSRILKLFENRYLKYSEIDLILIKNSNKKFK